MKNLFLRLKSRFTKNAYKNSQYVIGDYTYGNPRILSWGENCLLKIGMYCSISTNVTIFLGGEHNTDWVSTYPFNKIFQEARVIEGHPKTKGDVIIGNDVWVGEGVTILSGVTIGDGAVIGARTVVTKDVPPYAIFAGNPAKIIRYRFDEEIIKELLKIQWWNWPNDKVLQELPLIMSSNIDEFIHKHR